MIRGRAYLLSIGSNVAASRWVPRALAILRARFDVEAVSSSYDVGAAGPPGQPRFVNLAVRLRTDLPLRGLRAVCRHVEALCERVRGGDRFAPRTLDLDVVYDASRAEAVHEDLRAAAYVLVPCAEIWPEARLGADGPTLADEAARRFPGWAAPRRIEEP